MLTSGLGHAGLATLETLVHQQVWESGAKWENNKQCQCLLTHFPLTSVLWSKRTSLMCSRCYVNYYCLWSGFLCYVSSTWWSKEEEEEEKRKNPLPNSTLLLSSTSVSPLPSTPLRTRQCAPSLVLSATRWHTPSLHFSMRWKTSPCGAHFSLTHSSAHHLKCVGTLKWLWWLSALLEHQTWSSPYILCKLLYTSNWNGTQTSMRAGTWNIMKSRPYMYIVGVYCWALSVEAGVHCITS